MKATKLQNHEGQSHYHEARRGRSSVEASAPLLLRRVQALLCGFKANMEIHGSQALLLFLYNARQHTEYYRLFRHYVTTLAGCPKP